MDLGRLILADPQPPEVVQPRQGPLYVPAVFAQPAPVRRPPPRDVRTDAAPAQLPAMWVRVVAPIAIQAARPASGTARPESENPFPAAGIPPAGAALTSDEFCVRKSTA